MKTIYIYHDLPLITALMSGFPLECISCFTHNESKHTFLFHKKKARVFLPWQLWRCYWCNVILGISLFKMLIAPWYSAVKSWTDFQTFAHRVWSLQNHKNQPGNRLLSNGENVLAGHQGLFTKKNFNLPQHHRPSKLFSWSNCRIWMSC
jgi:hypothetical protein